MADEKRKILFEESVRGLSEQVAAADRARAAAATLLTATALVTAFLGGRALEAETTIGGPQAATAVRHAEITTIGWAAVCCFFAGLVISLFVALPRRFLGFSLVTTHDIYALIDDFLADEPARTEDDLYYHLAYWNYFNSGANTRALKRMRRILALGGAFLVAQAVLWLLVLSGK